MTYNVFGGTLNPAQSNPIDAHQHVLPCPGSASVCRVLNTLTQINDSLHRYPAQRPLASHRQSMSHFEDLVVVFMLLQLFGLLELLYLIIQIFSESGLGDLEVLVRYIYKMLITNCLKVMECFIRLLN